MSYSIKAGDTLHLKLLFTDMVTGTPHDLTGSTVRVVVARGPDAAPISEGTATIIGDPKEGRADYTARDGESDAPPGAYHVEATANWPDGRQVTTPSNGWGLIHIGRRLARAGGAA